MILDIKVIISFLIGYLLSNLTSKINNFSISSETVTYESITDDNIHYVVSSWMQYDKDTVKNIYGDISVWDTSSVTDMNDLFITYDKVNEDISKWNTSSVTDMSHMFSNVGDIKVDISRWNTSKVTNMSGMFKNTKYMSQAIYGDINTKSITKSDGTTYIAWDTSKVGDMNHMFDTATSFNQDISGWDTNKVGDMSYMFRDATSFNQDISGWDTNSVTDMSKMFYGTSGLYVNNKMNIQRSWCDILGAKILNSAFDEPVTCFIGPPPTHCDQVIHFH